MHSRSSSPIVPRVTWSRKLPHRVHARISRWRSMRTRRKLLTVFRDPPVLRTLTLDGMLLTEVDVCRDADDVFSDHKRQRTYVICGQGVVDVLDDNGSPIQRIPTATGARTGLFVPELDRLFVAVPARTGKEAEIRVFGRRRVHCRSKRSRSLHRPHGTRRSRAAAAVRFSPRNTIYRMALPVPTARGRELLPPPGRPRRRRKPCAWKGTAATFNPFVLN